MLFRRVTFSFILLFLSLDSEGIERLPKKYHLEVIHSVGVAGPNWDQLAKAIRTAPEEHLDALGFLLANAPARDLQTLTADFLLEEIRLSYEARDKTPWGPTIPPDIFLNNVLPYAHVTEKREPWRKDFMVRFLEMAVQEGSIRKAVKKLNQEVFRIFNVRYHATLRRKPDQSPSESIAIGYASCTGLSILIADALRAVGIPARLAGIPLWPVEGGNHTWVEVWDGGWHYIEAAADGEYDQTWFSGRARTADPAHEMTRIYGASFEKTPVRFPLVWDSGADYVRAEDVTARYIQIP